MFEPVAGVVKCNKHTLYPKIVCVCVCYMCDFLSHVSSRKCECLNRVYVFVFRRSCSFVGNVIPLFLFLNMLLSVLPVTRGAISQGGQRVEFNETSPCCTEEHSKYY